MSDAIPGYFAAKEIVEKLGLQGLQVTHVKFNFEVENAVTADVKIILTHEQYLSIFKTNLDNPEIS